MTTTRRTTGYFDHCPECGQRVSVRHDGLLRVHGPVGVGCTGSRRRAPAFAGATVLPWQQQEDQK